MNEATNKQPEPKQLYRSIVDKMIGGVCGGFAEYFDIDATLVRVIWLILGFMGFGIIAYLACLVVMRENPHQDIRYRKVHQNTGIIVGAVFILLGLTFFSSTINWGFFQFRPYHFHLFRPWFVSWDKFWPIIIILIGVFYLYHVMKQEKKQSEDTNMDFNEKKLNRSTKEKMIGGVCSGIAKYLNIDPVLMRVLWILVTLFSGIIFGVIVYIILLVIIPEEEIAAETTSSSPAKRSPRNKKVSETKE